MMNRRSKLLSFAGLTTVFAGAALAVSMGVAVAHHPVLGGRTACTDGAHVITWAIGNSQVTQEMTIASITAVLDTNGTDYGVTGYTSPVAPYSFTVGKTTVPGTLTGTVKLTVDGQWPNNFHAIRNVDVSLGDPCEPTTTQPPPTTAPPTTAPPTTSPGETTAPPTTGDTATSETPTTACVDTPLQPCALAYTGGGNPKGPSGVGVAAIILGVLLLAAAGFSFRPRLTRR